MGIWAATVLKQYLGFLFLLLFWSCSKVQLVLFLSSELQCWDVAGLRIIGNIHKLSVANVTPNMGDPASGIFPHRILTSWFYPDKLPCLRNTLVDVDVATLQLLLAVPHKVPTSNSQAD